MNGAGQHEHAAAAPVRTSGMAAMLAAWAPVALWMGVIFWLSGDQFSDTHTAVWLTNFPLVSALGLPPAVIEVGNVIVRKCAHFVEYAVLGMLAYRAVGMSWPATAPRRALVAAVAMAIAVAAADELHQTTTLYRTGNSRDVALDSVGALAGASTGASILYRRARR